MTALTELEMETFREVADYAPVMLWRITADFEGDWVNKAWLDFTGESLETQVGFGWLSRLHPDDSERTAEVFDLAFSNRSPASVEFRLQRRDGVYRWFLDTGVPVFRDMLFAGFVGSCVDITDRKEAERQIVNLQRSLIAIDGGCH